jgi:adenosylhomocysteine nucleosidase
VIFEKGGALVVCGGIGQDAAFMAADLALSSSRAEVLVSAGFAGALQPEGRVAEVLCPAVVVGAESGERFNTLGGRGTLVSSREVLQSREKHLLAARFNAEAVDMEAVAVAAVARQRGVGFLAVKAVSDELGSDLPPVGRFVDRAGRFQTTRFLAHMVLRPHLWPMVGRLARDSERAARALCRQLELLLTDEGFESFVQGRAQSA